MSTVQLHGLAGHAKSYAKPTDREGNVFVQIIEFRTSSVDEVRKIGDELLPERGPDWTARRAVICDDRDNPGHIVQVVFFDSYESAMQNSALPITQRLNDRMSPLMDGPPTFYNLDVVDDRTF